jgi:ABC-2 type transport system ATP-binding protein
VTRHPREARARLAAVPQHIALYPHATAAQNLRLYASLGGLRGRQLRRQINEVTDALGLSGLLHQPVRVLSGGQQRRLQAATALILDPPVLLLDEPTVGADVEARKAILSVVRWQAKRGSAICYTTHYLPELEDLQATLAIIAGGKVIARGSRTRLLADIPAKLRLRFSDVPPAGLVATYADRSVMHDGELIITATAPLEELAGIIRNFRDMADSLIGIDVVTPDLDDLYRHLTGLLPRTNLQNVY